MKIVFTFKRQGRKQRVVEVNVPTLELTDARVLWEFEQWANTLAGSDTHLSVDLHPISPLIAKRLQEKDSNV